MKLVLLPELFTARPLLADLAMLCSCALNGHHKIEVHSPDDPNYLQWLANVGRALQEEWQVALEISARTDALEPSEIIVQCGSPATDWTSRPIKLSLADSLAALRGPYKIVVEDGINDRAFFLNMASTALSSRLEKMESDGTVQFVNGGGLGGILRHVNELTTRPLERMRTTVIFDSDAKEPGRPSDDSETVRRACERVGVAYYQLQRRTAENYLTLFALVEWCRRRGKDLHRDLFSAFDGLNSHQKSHYHLKKGLAEDRPPSQIFASLAGHLRTALDQGFGNNVASLFREPGMIREEHLRREGMWAEMNPVVNRLLLRIQ